MNRYSAKNLCLRSKLIKNPHILELKIFKFLFSLTCVFSPSISPLLATNWWIDSSKETLLWDASHRTGLFSLTELAEELEKLPEDAALEHLSITHSDNNDDEGLAAVVNALGRLENFRSLLFGRVHIGEKSAEAIATSLDLLSELSFFLCENISDNAAQIIADALAKNESLDHLTIRSPKMSENGFKSFLSALEKNNFIGSIKFYSKSIKGCDIELFGILNNNSYLVDFELHIDELESSAIEAMGRGLKENNTLKKLTLGYSRSNCESGINAIADALSINNTLKDLEISFSISDASAAALALALERNSSLESLKIFGLIDDRIINDNAAIAFSNMLKVNQTLAEISLSGQGIGDEGAKAIAAALLNNETVEKFSFHASQMSDIGIAAIAKAVEGNTFMVSLDLQGKTDENGLAVGRHGIDAIRNLVEKNGTLEELNVLLALKPPFSEDVKEIAEALKQNSSLMAMKISLFPADAASFKTKSGELASTFLKRNKNLAEHRRSLETEVEGRFKRLNLGDDEVDSEEELSGEEE